MNLNFDDIPDDPSLPMPILPGHVSAGRLERVLRAGAFAVTSEMDPPDSANPEEVFARARIFDGYVTPSTPPTAPALTVTCPAWRSRRC